MRRRSSGYSSDRFPPYVPVAQRARDAAAAVAKLRKRGHAVEPVAIDGRAITTTFWGKAWCGHLESLSDFRNRLPRGRTYVRRGAVVHLTLDSGRIVAKVQGGTLYDIEIGVTKLQAKRWSKVVAECTGNIDSLVELLRGKLSDSVMRAVTNPETGLFPAASELRMSCSCPDWAGLCKHLAAVLYGVGARLDARPELLFTLRGVDPSELVEARAAAAISEAKTEGQRSRRVLPSSGLSDVFGIELEGAPTPRAARGRAEPPRAKSAASKRSLGVTNASRSIAPDSLARAPAQEPALVPKRSSTTDVGKTAALILEFVKSHPGVGVEFIGKSMGLSTKQLSLPLKKLVALGSIVRSGLGRATTYVATHPPAGARGHGVSVRPSKARRSTRR